MASGDSLFILRPRMYIPPGSAAGVFATLGVIVDTGLVPMKTPVLWYEDDADSHADFKIILPSHYTGGVSAVGITFEPHYATDGTATTDIEWEIRVLDLSVGDDLGADLGIDEQAAATSTDAPSSTADAYDIAPTAALTDDQFGSPDAETEIVVRVTRDVSASANADRAGLIGLYATET